MLEVHEKKSSQVAKHDGECRHRTNQIEGVRGRWGELARHPAGRNGRGQLGRNSSFRCNPSRCHKFPSERRLNGSKARASIAVWTREKTRVSTSDCQGPVGPVNTTITHL